MLKLEKSSYLVLSFAEKNFENNGVIRNANDNTDKTKNNKKNTQAKGLVWIWNFFPACKVTCSQNNKIFTFRGIFYHNLAISHCLK